MPTTINAHRAQLLQHLEKGETYSFLNLADHYLEVCPDDHHVRLMTAREYLNLGLVDPAREVLDDPSAQCNLPNELRAVAASLRSVSKGSVDWSQREDRARRNLQSLHARGIDVAAIRNGWQEHQTSYRLYTDANGVDQLRARTDEGRWRWIPFLGHHPHVDAARPLPQGLNTQMPVPILLDGLGAGFFFERIHRATTNTFLGYSCAIFIVEPQLDLFAAALHLHDWTDLLADPRVFLFLGCSFPAQMRAAWETDPDLPLPAQAVNLSPHRTHEPDPITIIREISDKKERAANDSWLRVQRQYADRDPAFWANRFTEALEGRGQPLRILSAVSTHTTFLQHSMRDTKRALEVLGHQCTVLTEKTQYGIISPQTFHQAVLDLDPDLFFSIDHLRPEFANVVPPNLPIFTWDQDQLPHVFTRENVAKIGPLDTLAGTTKNYFLRIGGKPEQFLCTYIPTSPEQFDGPPLTNEEHRRYACDVSYVSHASQTPRQFHEDERRQHADANVRNVLDAIYELMPAALATHRVANGFVIEELLETASQKCGLVVTNPALRERLLWWYSWRLGDRLFRHEALEWVATWARETGRTFRIYGNGWDKHPTLAPFAAGPAANGRELLCIHRASKINLQLMPAGFIHQRALDGLTAGGFFLTRLVPNDLRGRPLRELMRRIADLKITTTHELTHSPDPQLQELLRAVEGREILHPETANDAVPTLADAIPYRDRKGAALPGGRAGNPVSATTIPTIRLEHALDRRPSNLLTYLQTNAELPYADELFPDFPDIVFDSSADFQRLAERCLADDNHRSTLANSMRAVVLREFTYESTLTRFLTHAMNHLRRHADRAGKA